MGNAGGQGIEGSQAARMQPGFIKNHEQHSHPKQHIEEESCFHR